MEIESLAIKAESRFKEWLERENLKEQPHSKVELPTLTFSRQYGCEALKLIEKVKCMLEPSFLPPVNLRVVSRQKIVTYLKEQGFLDQNSFPEINDFNPRLGLRIFQDFKGFLFQPNWRTPEEHAYEILSRYLRVLARQGGVIILELGGCIVIQDIPQCLHFRLEASLDYRVRTVMNRSQLTYLDAKKEVLYHQQRRDRFAAKLLRSDLGQVKHYHMVFNCDQMSLDDMAQIIVQMACGKTRSSSLADWPSDMNQAA